MTTRIKILFSEFNSFCVQSSSDVLPFPIQVAFLSSDKIKRLILDSIPISKIHRLEVKQSCRSHLNSKNKFRN